MHRRPGGFRLRGSTCRNSVFRKDELQVTGFGAASEMLVRAARRVSELLVSWASFEEIPGDCRFSIGSLKV